MWNIISKSSRILTHSNSRSFRRSHRTMERRGTPGQESAHQSWVFQGWNLQHLPQKTNQVSDLSFHFIWLGKFLSPLFERIAVPWMQRIYFLFEIRDALMSFFFINFVKTAERSFQQSGTHRECHVGHPEFLGMSRPRLRGSPQEVCPHEAGIVEGLAGRNGNWILDLKSFWK